MRFKPRFKYAGECEAWSPVETCWWMLAAWQRDADEAWQAYVETLT